MRPSPAAAPPSRAHGRPPRAGTVHRPPAGRPLLAIAAVLLLAACTTAEALPTDAPAAATAQPDRHPALAIVDRLDAAAADPTPDVVGVDGHRARAALAAVGGEAVLVALSEEDVVTAQYPAAGAPLPADRAVVVWLGTPPAPPAPPPPPAPADVGGPQDAGAGQQPTEAGPSGTQLALAQPLAPAPAPAAAPVPPSTAAPAPAPVAGSQPAPVVGSQPAPVAGAAAPPAPGTPPPPRANIRTMAPAAPGTVLEGPASWYGPGFAGNTTACGGVFDPGQLTLATRELRCGTRVLVTGPSGASVEATVTDWGPAEWTNRRFDLSAATFAAIHHPGAGVVNVRLEVVG